MIRQELIEDLQDKVSKQYFVNIKELQEECDKYKELDIETYENILSPMEWTTCDRCGDLYDSQLLLWIDWLRPETKKDEYMFKAIVEEKQEYCAVCDKCVAELIKKGKQL